ncbi:MAG: hypothetical protein ACI87J_001720 [Colwellia sp.]|jgi:hypothetical protein
MRLIQRMTLKWWGYVDKNKLARKELALIKLLTEQVGNGYFMPVAA